MSIVDSVLQQAERVQEESKFSLSKEERMKKYFTPYLSQDEKSGVRRIRILPTKDGSSPFVEAYFHEVKIDKKYYKLYDPGKNDGERSPLNEAYDVLRESSRKSDRDYANNYKSRLFYVVKVVDRDHEDEGVKFWRIKHSYKNDGPYDKIISVIKAKGDIFDVEKGRDLLVHLSKQKSNNGKEYTAVQTVLYEDASPLSDSPETVEEWMTDELTWRDVYSRKSEEYLEAVAKGKIPKWDTVSEDYVFLEPGSNDSNFGGGNDDFDDDVELPF